MANSGATSWDKEKAAKARDFLKNYEISQLHDVLGKLSRLLGQTVSQSSLLSAFKRYGLRPPGSYMRRPAIVGPAFGEAGGSDFLRVLNRRKGATLEQICNELDWSPKRVHSEIARLRTKGVKVAEVHGAIEIVRRGEITTLQKTGIAPVIGHGCAGVISDLHYGSRYCHEDWITDCVKWLYAQGVRLIYVPGDIMTGDYRHSRYELTCVGLQEQANRTAAGLPCLPGLSYHGITGNHDDTFGDTVGVDPGDFLVDAFKRKGRKDLFMYGRRGAFVQAQGIVVHMWHPRGSNPYARSYELQKKVESYSPGQKPNILLAGHRHFFGYVMERGVHAFACPTFEGGQSPFGNSLKSQPHFGGMLLKWERTRDGTLRTFSHELRSYYENEGPRKMQTARKGA